MIPGSANPLLLATAAGAAGYQIERSLRFNSADSAYLSRTPGSAGNRKTWTWAGWLKKVKNTNGLYECMFGVSGNSEPYLRFQFRDDNTLILEEYNGSVFQADLRSTSIYRDNSAWYHIVAAVDTTQATSSDRIKLYINGVRLTSFSTATYPSQNADLIVNSTVRHDIGNMGVYYSSRYFNGYLADIHFIDGQALDPTSFGEFDDNGIWQPIDTSGLTYGTNGFHLDFADNSSAAALGYDAAGSNDWTVNNLSVTAGAGNDSLVDSPTNYGTDTGAGGEVVGNYCTYNYLHPAGTVTYSNGNLDISGNSQSGQTLGTIAVSSGKWYYEATLTVFSGVLDPGCGITEIGDLSATSPGGSATSYAAYNYSSNTYIKKVNNGSFVDTNTTVGVQGDVIGIAFDLDAGKFWISKNGTWVDSGNPATGANSLYTVTAGTYVPSFRVGGTSVGSCTLSANFGARPFAYTAPSNFKALCTANLPTPTIADGSTTMNVATWIGDGTSPRSITGLNHAPDIVWTKNRGVAYWHNLYDVIRGARSPLHTNTTNTEDTANDALYGGVSAFDSDGFSLAAGTTSSIWANQSSQSYVGWCWDAGSSTGSNTDGSITSSVRANANGGISIVSYTGTGSNATVGHGLGVAPGAVIIKSRNLASQNWVVYIKDASTTAGAYMLLSSNAGVATTTSVLNGTNPTSSVFSIGTSTSTNNSSSTYIAYCFSPVVGFSAMGTYAGNGNSLGAYVYTGHRPRWIMVKRTDTTADWTILDTSREGYNVDNDPLYANQAYVEGTTDLADIVSNGFKLRTTDASVNASGGTYAYISFAEHPFSLARAR